MTRPVVERITARVRLDDPAPELERARELARRGDEDMAEWLERFERDEAVVLRLDVSVHLGGPGAGDGSAARTVDVGNRGIWLERADHPPTAEKQLHEIAGKDSEELAAALREHGLECSPADVEDMLVHIELDDDVRRLMRRAKGGGRARRGLRSHVGETPP